MSTLKTAEDLDQLLSDLNEAGTNPVVVGFDANGRPFLAYGWTPGGDGWDAGFVDKDTHSSEFDYTDGTKRCEECGAFDRRSIDKLVYPVMVVTAASLAKVATDLRDAVVHNHTLGPENAAGMLATLGVS